MSVLGEVLLSSATTIVFIIGAVIKMAITSSAMGAKVDYLTRRLSSVENKIDRLSDDVAALKATIGLAKY